VNQTRSSSHKVRPKLLALTAFGFLAFAVRSAPAQTSGACITEQETCESTLPQDGAAHGGAAAAASLWLQDIGHIDEISPSQLKHSGMVTPTMLKSFNGDLNHAIGLCFDKSKNLWVTNFDNAVFEFTAAQLSQLMTTANPPPVVTITSSSSFTEIYGCAFDSNSNLWVVHGGGKGVHEISNAQLNAGSGDITPAINISCAAAQNGS
jgi:sugar lactone lactonase YvrE